MTISTSSSSVTYTGNGATTVFSYAFLIPDATSAVVYLTTIADSSTIILPPSSYTIAGLNSPGGGSVTYPIAGAALSSLYRITIQRVLPLTQPTDIVNQSGFYPEVIEDALDRLCMQIQQLNAGLNQALIFPPGTTPDLTALIAQIMAGSANAAASAASAAAAAASAAAAAASAVSAASAIPVGLEADWPVGTTTPSLWLLEYGQVISQVTYAILHVAIGNVWNTGGEPVGTFRLPDRRGVVVAGKTDMGGVDKGNLTNGNVVTNIVGNQSKSLVAAENGPHAHANSTLTSVEDAVHAHLTSGATGIWIVLGGTTGTAHQLLSPQSTDNIGVFAPNTGAESATHHHLPAATDSNGSGTAFSLVQPTGIANKIIYAGV